MSYGFHRMGSSVPGKALPRIIFIEDGVTVPTIAKLTTPPLPMPSRTPKPTLPSMADTVVAPSLTNSQARDMGYTGNECQTCNSLRMKIAGHCEVCEDCGNSSGCS